MNFRMPLLAVALLDLHVNSCPQEHFQLPDRVCCHYCPAGWYVASNCTRNGSHVSGVKCSPCSVCANGTQTIASCARFSDTQCTETVSRPQTSWQRCTRHSASLAWFSSLSWPPSVSTGARNGAFSGTLQKNP